MDVDDLRLPTLQGLHVTHQPYRIADARSKTNATAASRREPLHLAGRQIEQIDNGAGDPEQLPQRHKRRRGNRLGPLLSEQGPVDLLHELQPLDRPLSRHCRLHCLGLPNFQRVGHVIERTCQLSQLSLAMR